MVLFEVREPVEDNELDVVVALRREQLAVAVGRRSDRRRRSRQRHQSARALVHNAIRVRVRVKGLGFRIRV